MKRLEEYIREDHSFLVKSKAKPQEYKYFPKDRDELVSIIEEKIQKEGNTCDLNDIDVSKVETMIGLFAQENTVGGSTTRCKFNGDISLWDVRTVKNMYCMFENSDFNGDISNWDVSNVKNMHCMFDGSKFNGDISNWDVSNVEYMQFMFTYSKFNRDISNWDVRNVKDMNYMFDGCPLQNHPPKWYKEK